MKRIFYLISLLFFTLISGSGLNASTSEIKIINGNPTLFLNQNQMTDTTFVELYYFIDPIKIKSHSNQVTHAEGPAWVNLIKKRLDLASSLGIKIFFMRIWWSDIDKSTKRPIKIPDNFDYKYYDLVLEYAKQKGIYVILSFELHWAYPKWWKEENKLPTFWKANAMCDFCEMDYFGRGYNTVSFGSEKVKKDFGDFMKATITRYKDHQALLGWNVGLGPSGEDGYGPNYIIYNRARQISYGDQEGVMEERDYAFTDFSPSFKRAFKNWLKNKYKTSAAFKKAWSDYSVSLENLVMPKPEDLVKEAFQPKSLFPDAAMEDGNIHNDQLLTAKGKDFYAFREFLREEDTDYYASLVKQYDPNHILIFNGVLRESLLKNKKIDGIHFNPNLNYMMDGKAFIKIMWNAERAIKRGKLAFIGNENSNGSLDLEAINEEYMNQRYFLEYTGKAEICTGAYMGVTQDLLDESDPSKIWIPSWHFDGAIEAAKKIASYKKEAR